MLHSKSCFSAVALTTVSTIDLQTCSEDCRQLHKLLLWKLNEWLQKKLLEQLGRTVSKGQEKKSPSLEVNTSSLNGNTALGVTGMPLSSNPLARQVVSFKIFLPTVICDTRSSSHFSFLEVGYSRICERICYFLALSCENTKSLMAKHV